MTMTASQTQQQRQSVVNQVVFLLNRYQFDPQKHDSLTIYDKQISQEIKIFPWPQIEPERDSFFINIQGPKLKVVIQFIFDKQNGIVISTSYDGKHNEAIEIYFLMSLYDEINKMLNKEWTLKPLKHT